MIIFWLTCLVGYPRTSAPEPRNLSVYVAIRLQSLQGAGEHLLRNIGDELAEGVEAERLLPASPR